MEPLASPAPAQPLPQEGEFGGGERDSEEVKRVPPPPWYPETIFCSWGGGQAELPRQGSGEKGQDSGRT